MTVDAWAAIGVAVAAGFAGWMFRIDRAVQKIGHLADSLREHKDMAKSDRIAIWDRLQLHDDKLADHGERIARNESQLAPPESRRTTHG